MNGAGGGVYQRAMEAVPDRLLERLPWWGLGIVTAVFLIYSLLDLWQMRVRFEAEAIARLENHSHVLKQSLERQLVAVDDALRSIRSVAAEKRHDLARDRELHNDLNTLVEALPIVRTMLVFDAEGTVEAGNRAELVGRNFVGRDYFKDVRSAPRPDRLFVAAPFTTALGVYTINLVRPRYDGEGRFAGIVSATVDAEALHTILAEMSPIEGTRLSVSHENGALLVLFPTPIDRDLPKQLTGGSLLRQHLDSGVAQNLLRGRSESVGTETLISMRSIDLTARGAEDGLVVGAARDLADIYAPWRQLVRSRLVFIAVLLLFAVGLIKLLHRRTRHVQASMEQLIAAMPDGLLVVNRQGKVLYGNGVARAMFGGTLPTPADIALSPDGTDTLTEVRTRDPDGGAGFAEIRMGPLLWQGGAATIVSLRDITKRKALEEQIRNSREILRQFLDHFPGTAYVKNDQLRVLMASRGFKTILGMDPEQMVGRSNEELFPGPFGEKISADDRRVLDGGAVTSIEEEFGGRYFESTKFPIVLDGQRLLGGTTVDVTVRHRAALRTTFQLQLANLAGQRSEREFLDEGLEMAQSLTGSEIGFLHFVNADQESLELKTWTRGALQGCQAAYDNHYPISEAGIWADCFRERRAVVFNDYASYGAKRGLPDGHARLLRLISVPVIEGGQIRVIMGVGNKASDYDDFDVESVQLIGNDLWRVARRMRAETELKARVLELTETNQKLAQAQNQLLQSEKMATIGQLAAGVAHELNNPIGFVQSNLGSLLGYVEDLLEIIEHSQQCASSCPDQRKVDALKRLCADKDFDFIKDDIRQLLNESRDGADRVRRIVQNLKDFSHVSEDEWLWADLHQGLDSTLTLVWNELKYKAEVEKQYGTLPEVYCVASQINQVVMNLLVNAAQAIEGKGKIILRTGTADTTDTPAAVWVEIEDTGKGIPPENLKKIFDPFFTTKPVGKGTGLGLSLAWSIVEKHHGHFEVRSTVGQGTTFRITLPVRQPERQDPS